MITLEGTVTRGGGMAAIWMRNDPFWSSLLKQMFWHGTVNVMIETSQHPDLEGRYPLGLRDESVDPRGVRARRVCTVRDCRLEDVPAIAIRGAAADGSATLEIIAAERIPAIEIGRRVTVTFDPASGARAVPVPQR